MRVTAGERAVHIIMSYDQADALLGKLEPGEELYARLALKVPEGRAKGRPKPKLPNPSWPVIRNEGDPPHPADV